MSCGYIPESGEEIHFPRFTRWESMTISKFAATALFSVAATTAIAGTAQAAPGEGRSVVANAAPSAEGVRAATPVALTAEQAQYCKTAIINGMIGMATGSAVGLVAGSGIGAAPGAIIGSLLGAEFPAGPMPGPNSSTGSALAPESPAGVPVLYRCGGIFAFFQ